MIELFAALVLAAGSPAAGAAPEAPPQAASTEVATQTAAPPAATKAKPKSDKVVCHLEMELGSHFSRKICVTARTAGERSQDDRDALHDIQDHASSPTMH